MPTHRTEARARPRPRSRTSARHLIRERRDLLLVISLGGALGSLARWGLAEAFPHPAGGWPWGTFWANVSGGFLLGLLMILIAEVGARTRYVRPFLGVGLLGGYTTFSTWMLETRDLLAAGEPARAAAYVLGTLVLGLAAVLAGTVTGRSWIMVARHRRAGRREDR